MDNEKNKRIIVEANQLIQNIDFRINQLIKALGITDTSVASIEATLKSEEENLESLETKLQASFDNVSNLIAEAKKKLDSL